MKMTKKVLGVILALAMLVNVFAMFSFAAAPDSAVDLTLSVDKPYYSTGDIVTITVSVKVEDEVGDMRIGGQYCFGYDSNAIEPVSTSDVIGNHYVTAHQDGLDESNSYIKFSDVNIGEGQEIDAGNNWDSIFQVALADDNGATTFSATAGVDLFTFQMKITDSAADGDYIFGFNKRSFDDYFAFANDATMGGIYGTDCHYYSTTDDYSFGSVTIKVGAPTPVGPVVAKAAQQAKFTAEGDGVAEEFLLRVKSVITSDDWDNYFANTADAAATTDKITNVGIVAYKGTEGFDADTAKAVVSGTPATGYSAAETDYIQHTADNDAYFGAIIKLNHLTCDYDTTYMGFVKYLDSTCAEQVIFYDAQVAGTSTNYATAVAAFKAL